jgi:hypothetical protein
MSNVIPFPTAEPGRCRDGPDPALGDAIIAAAAAVERQPTSLRALRRLARLLAPGISEFHERHRELSTVFDRIREGGGALEAQQLQMLLAISRSEAAFLITGRV